MGSQQIVNIFFREENISMHNKTSKKIHQKKNIRQESLPLSRDVREWDSEG